MTMLQPTDLTASFWPSLADAHVADTLADRVMREGHQACLDDVLHDVVVRALGPDARVAVAKEDWTRVEEVIRGPIAAAVAAALERLAADVDAVLPWRLPELTRRLGDHRLKAELGYD